ncbi:uncharacterized protein LOC142325475 [Lycorma delicatula]|uniref:uncharacterized protein LOC142325475 n=1 Tax=Lycorma delicatula TaxID=130591 RepID=UPI003F514B15
MIDRVKNTIGIILISITIVNAYIFTYPKNYEKYEKIYNILIQSDDQIMSNFERFVIDDINNYSNDDVVDFIKLCRHCKVKTKTAIELTHFFDKFKIPVYYAKLLLYFSDECDKYDGIKINEMKDIIRYLWMSGWKVQDIFKLIFKSSNKIRCTDVDKFTSSMRDKEINETAITHLITITDFVIIFGVSDAIHTLIDNKWDFFNIIELIFTFKPQLNEHLQPVIDLINNYKWSEKDIVDILWLIKMKKTDRSIFSQVIEFLKKYAWKPENMRRLIEHTKSEKLISHESIIKILDEKKLNETVIINILIFQSKILKENQLIDVIDYFQKIKLNQSDIEYLSKNIKFNVVHDLNSIFDLIKDKDELSETIKILNRIYELNLETNEVREIITELNNCCKIDKKLINYYLLKINKTSLKTTSDFLNILYQDHLKGKDLMDLLILLNDNIDCANKNDLKFITSKLRKFSLYNECGIKIITSVGLCNKQKIDSFITDYQKDKTDKLFQSFDILPDIVKAKIDICSGIYKIYEKRYKTELLVTYKNWLSKKKTAENLYPVCNIQQFIQIMKYSNKRKTKLDDQELESLFEIICKFDDNSWDHRHLKRLFQYPNIGKIDFNIIKTFLKEGTETTRRLFNLVSDDIKDSQIKVLFEITENYFNDNTLVVAFLNIYNDWVEMKIPDIYFECNYEIFKKFTECKSLILRNIDENEITKNFAKDLSNALTLIKSIYKYQVKRDVNDLKLIYPAVMSFMYLYCNADLLEKIFTHLPRIAGYLKTRGWSQRELIRFLYELSNHAKSIDTMFIFIENIMDPEEDLTYDDILLAVRLNDVWDKIIGSDRIVAINLLRLYQENGNEHENKCVDRWLPIFINNNTRFNENNYKVIEHIFKFACSYNLHAKEFKELSKVIGKSRFSNDSKSLNILLNRLLETKRYGSIEYFLKNFKHNPDRIYEIVKGNNEEQLNSVFMSTMLIRVTNTLEVN